MRPIQLTGDETLGMRLTGAIADNEVSWSVNYHDELPENIISYSAKGLSSGTDFVEMVPASPDGYTRVVTELSIVNVDTKSHIARLIREDNGDETHEWIRAIEVDGELHLPQSPAINVQSGGDSLWEYDGGVGVKPKDSKTVDGSHLSGVIDGGSFQP